MYIVHFKPKNISNKPCQFTSTNFLVQNKTGILKYLMIQIEFANIGTMVNLVVSLNRILVYSGFDVDRIHCISST